MPDRHGFNHLVDRGTITKRCIWCPYSPPVSASESVLSRHFKKHRKDREGALEASRREKEISESL